MARGRGGRDLLHRAVVGAGIVVGDPHQAAGHQQAHQVAAVDAPAGEGGPAALVDRAAAEEQERDRQQHDRRQDRGPEKALVEGGHDVAAGPELDQEGAGDRAEQADPADQQREQHQRVLSRAGKEDRAQEHGRDHGHGVGLEQVGRHAGAVADVVADVVRDHGRIARIVLGDARLDFSHKIGAHVGALGEDAAAQPREDRDQRGAEAEPDQRFQHRAGVEPEQQEKTVVAGDAEQAERHDQQTGHRARPKRDVEPAREAASCRLGGAHVGPDRDVHADVAGRAREQGADQKAEADVKPEKNPEQQEDHHADARDRHVLPVQVGHGTFLDRARDLAHARGPRRLGQDQLAGRDPIGEADRAAGQDQQIENPIDTRHRFSRPSPAALHPGRSPSGRRARNLEEPRPGDKRAPRGGMALQPPASGEASCYPWRR